MRISRCHSFHILWAVGWLLCHASLIARDCNGNGIEDTDDIASGFSPDCNNNAIPDECEGWPIRFTKGPTWSLDDANGVLATGDANGDGFADLVVADGSTLKWFRGDRGRTMVSSTEISLPNGSIDGLALDDFNGDEQTDILLASGDGLFLLINEGEGRFLSPVENVLQPATFVHAADLNGDGAPDLISVHPDQDVVSIRFSLADESGQFADVLEVGQSGTMPRSVVSGDLDRDGDRDLVVANEASGDFSIFLNDGEGQFTQHGTFKRGSIRFDTHSLNLTDLNGDGYLDIAVTTAAFQSILFNLGDATFGDPTKIHSESIFHGLNALTMIDADGDGDQDPVTVSSRNGVIVRQNGGEGIFDHTWKLGTDKQITAMATGDFDGDGWDDLALVRDFPADVSILWNDGSQRDAASGWELEVLPLEGCSDSRGCRPHGGTLADLDGDGDLEGIGLMTHPGEFHFVDNEQGIMVTRPEAYTFGRNGRANGEHSQWVAPGDLDGDGDMDLVTVDNNSNEFWVHINRGDGSFEPVDQSRRLDVGNAPQHVSLADLDNDGDLDGIASNLGRGTLSLLFNRGDGSFDPNDVEITTGSATRGTAIADLDGDGYKDIVAANSSGRSISIVMNNGDGTFPDRGKSRSLTGNPYDVTIADFDQDGDPDIAASVGDRRSCAILLNLGSSVFGGVSYSSPAYYPIEEQGAYAINTADLNGDGALDLVTANEASGSITILHGRGDGTFEAPESHSVGTGAGNRMALPGDLDGDGDLDLMTFNRGNHTASVLHNRTALDAPDFHTSICTVADLLEISSETASAEARSQEFVKFILPVADGGAALNQPLFQNSRRYRLHQEFLTTVFPEHFPALDSATYDHLVGRRDSRHYFVGAIRVIRTPKGATYGFDVFARFGDSKERLSVGEVQAIREQLLESFALAPLVYAPTSLEAVEVARTWQAEAPFPILIEGSTGGFEPYTLGVGYGRVRILSAEAFEEANENGGISFQDILILERAPRDIEGVINGIITAERQGELSHVAIRTARRGTPNAFVRTAVEDFAELDGKLIRLQVTESGYTTREVTEEEAAAFWDANAGFLSHPPDLDEVYEALPALEEIAALDADAIVPTESRVGGKATNLARLQGILTEEWSRYRLNGFAVPMAYYLDFIRSNTMPSALDPNRHVTYETYLNELFEDEKFASDSSYRFEVLKKLRDHIEDFGVVDAMLIERLHDRITNVMGTPDNVRVRFRSSSNAEDAIEFNGAGLYDSTQGCVADDLDGDTEGPSLCNPLKEGERDIARALKRVWSSLWNFRAFEERAFYRIDASLPAMGVLVSEAFDGELANGVATTGNPTNRHDPRYVITVQKDDHSVVSPEPGVLPEKNILEVNDLGQVTNIIRAVTSTLVEPGEFVLSDDDLRELGTLMWHIDQNLPIDHGSYTREDIMLDIEFKKRSTNELAVKQVRPFLLSERGPAPPSFTLEILPDTVLCGKFDTPNLSRSAHDEVALKSQMHLKSGITKLPTAIDQFSGMLVDKLTLGQDRRTAVANQPGTFTLEKLPGDETGLLIYRFQYTQQLVFPNGDPVDVTWSLLDFRTRDGVIAQATLTLTEDYMIDQLSLRAEFDHRGTRTTNFYGSCTLEPLPLWEIQAEFADGTTVTLHERFRNEVFGDFQPAALVSARISVAGTTVETNDYWNLIYKAARHNEHVEHLVLFNDPVTVPGVEQPVHAIQVIAASRDHESEPEGRYLDHDLQEIVHAELSSYERTLSTIRRPSLAVPLVAIVSLDEGSFLTVTLDTADVTPRFESSHDLIQWIPEVLRLHSSGMSAGRNVQAWIGNEPIRASRSRFLRVVTP